MSTKSATCWGCGATQGEVSFSVCGKCVSEGLKQRNAKFCSRDCLKKNWPRHKIWHEEVKKHQERQPNFELSGEMLASLKAVGDGSFEHRYGEAMNKLAKGELKPARKMAQKLVKDYPRRAEAYFGLAMVCHDSVDVAGEIENATQAMKYATDDGLWSRAYFRAEGAFSISPDYRPIPSWHTNKEEFNAFSVRVLVTMPEDHRAWSNRSVALHEAGKLSEALKCLRQARALVEEGVVKTSYGELIRQWEAGAPLQAGTTSTPALNGLMSSVAILGGQGGHGRKVS